MYSLKISLNDFYKIIVFLKLTVNVYTVYTFITDLNVSQISKKLCLCKIKTVELEKFAYFKTFYIQLRSY